MKISKELKKQLLKSKYVEKVSISHVSYTKTFKHKALQLYEEGHSSNEIFSMLGFNPDDFVSGYFSGCLDRWSMILKKHKSFKAERRGRPQGKKHSARDLDQFSNDELKMIIEIQQEQLNILKK